MWNSNFREVANKKHLWSAELVIVINRHSRFSFQSVFSVSLLIYGICFRINEIIEPLQTTEPSYQRGANETATSVVATVCRHSRTIHINSTSKTRRSSNQSHAAGGDERPLKTDNTQAL